MTKIKQAQIALTYFVLASGAILLTRLNGGVALLWVANAPLLAALCRQKRAEWPALLVATALASISASALFGPVLWAAPFLALASVTEAAMAALILGRFMDGCDYIRSTGTILSFGLVTGVLAPLASGLIGATVAAAAFRQPWLPTYIDWAVGHGLGTLIASPLVLLMVDRDRRYGLRWLAGELAGSGGLLLGAVVVTAAAVFCQDRLPLLFMPALPILLATFKLGRSGAAISVVVIAVLGGVATATGHGPITMTHLSRGGQFQFFQAYLAATFTMALPAAGALGQREVLLRALAASEARHRRIVERSRDVIFEMDQHGRWTFLSEAWTRLTGQEASASLGARALASVIREDRRALALVQREAAAAPGAVGQAEVRFRNSMGVRWAAVSIALLTDDTGAVIGSYGTLSDVTERRAAAAAIAEQEKSYRLLAEATSDMIARIDLDGRFLWASPAAERLLGLAPDALVGASFFATVVREDQPLVRYACETLLGGATDQTVSFRQQRRREDPLWVEGAFRLVRDEMNHPAEYVVSVRDISRRKASEAEAKAALLQLSESNRLFSMAGALASIGHWRWDIGTDALFWSDEMFRIFGFEEGEQPPLDAVLARYHPDDRAHVLDAMARTRAEQSDMEVTARLLRPDGSLRHVVAHGQVERDGSGRMVAVFGVFQDVTERAVAEETLRDSEARFRLITEQASDMIALIDLDGVCRFMSPASAAILGVPPAEMVGSYPVERTHPEDRPSIQDYRRRLHAGETAPGASLRFRMARADGDYAWLEASSRMAEMGGGPCVVTVWRDVSTQVAIEHELRAARAAAEAATAAKAGFLANMSHEIRTPMNGVIGFAELLLDGELSGEQRRHASLIADSGRAMMKLLNDILDLSKIEAGQLDVVAEPFDLPHALRACGKLLGPSAAQKRLDLAVAVSDAVPGLVIGDALRVRQIVLNLLGNAIKFTERGSVRLAAELIGTGAARQLAISVTDTGIGISPERQSSIFEEFVQADHSITRRYGGTGLGLAISNRLATLLGGRITLASRPGEGTTVTLLLPAIGAEGRAAPVPAPVSPAARRAAHVANVLLAEDHDVNQLLIRAMLDRAGHRLTVVENGREAVDAVARRAGAEAPFDLVLMDMQMPVMDGLAATRAIRAAEAPGARRLPVVALTANAFAADLEACRAAGMDDHLAKPIAIEDLLATIERWTKLPAPAAPAAASKPAATKFRPSAAMGARYAEHRDRVLAEVGALVRRGTFTDAEVESVAALLHKLAGTAGMFGDAGLGDRASMFEEGLLTWPAAERAQRVPAAARALNEAA